MTSMKLYARPVKRTGPGSVEVVFGFALADHLTAPALRLADQHRSKQAYQALQSQLQMVTRFWSGNILAWDLRFVKTTRSANIATGLLCRISCPEYTVQEHYNQYCQSPGQYVQLLFKEFGYDLIPLPTWSDLKFFLEGFDYRSLAEIRRCESTFEIKHTYDTYEFYTTYPWRWSASPQRRLLDTLRRLPDDCLLSICLQPTRLNTHEQHILQRATSAAVSRELLNAGPAGRETLKIYEGFIRDLQQPFLLRIGLAASSSVTLERVGQTFLEELEPSHRTPNGPVLQHPKTSYELQALQQSLSLLEWVPWGDLRPNVQDTARLRYLVDSKEGSMAFRLPIPDTSTQIIRVLLIFANPSNQMRLELDREERAIREAIALSRYRDNIDLRVCPASTIHDFRRELMKQGFQIVHIASHGTDEGLVLANALGKTDVISPEGMTELLKLHRETYGTLHCVVLNACQSTLQGQLLSAGTPFVIAMEGSLDDQAAIEFARGFYDAIGEGMDISNAYKQGKVTVQTAASKADFRSWFFAQNSYSPAENDSYSF